jgi:hypothetical protein
MSKGCVDLFDLPWTDSSLTPWLHCSETRPLLVILFTLAGHLIFPHAHLSLLWCLTAVGHSASRHTLLVTGYNTAGAWISLVVGGIRERSRD